MNTRVMELSQQIKYFRIQCEDSSPDTKNPYEGQGGVVVICNIITGESKLRIPWASFLGRLAARRESSRLSVRIKFNK